MRTFWLALLFGWLLDWAFGDPQWLMHPVRLIGAYIGFCEKKLRARGGNLRRSAIWLASSTVLLTMGCAALAVAVARWLPWPHMELLSMAILDWLGFAARDMVKEASGVRSALTQGVGAARERVSRIVGRDTAQLDEEEIIKATVETVAENTTDGVISPMIYAALGGPVLLWGFKAASTLDSMVGYRDERYRDIGWASARLDDLLNFLPARLTALLLCIAALLTGQDAANALRIVRRDHRNHLSPNCAWSESAVAGALHIQLGGTHSYFGKPIEKPTIGDTDRMAQPEDIVRACRMLTVASGLFAFATALWLLL